MAELCGCKSMHPKMLQLVLWSAPRPRSRPNLERKFHHKVLVGALAKALAKTACIGGGGGEFRREEGVG